MPTARVEDPNGFMLIKSCPISSYGIFEYSAGQLGMDGDPNRIVNVFRPESAVSNQATLDSFKNVPFIIDHTLLSGFEDDETAAAPEEKGLDGVLTSDVSYAKPWMIGDLKIFSRNAKRALAGGKKDLSLGYSCDFEIKPGVFDGKAYEAIQTNMRGNHIALVDEGRVPGARVLDGLIFDHLSFDVRPSDKELIMAKTVKRPILRTVKSKAAMDNAVEQLKGLLPALQEFLNEEAKEPQHQDGEEGVEPEGGEAEPQMGEPDEMMGSTEDTPDISTLISEVEAVLAKLKAATGEEGAPEANQGEDGEPTAESETEDAVEGLNETAGETEPTLDESCSTEPVEASAGPAAGKHVGAEDSAIRRFYADAADKSRLYDGLSKVVGAFDHSRMDARQVASYGVKKLGLTVKSGNERFAVDAYLLGVNAANKNRANVATRKSVADSAHSEELSAYLEGVK